MSRKRTRPVRGKYDFLYAVAGTIIVAGILLHMFEQIILIFLAFVIALLE